MARVSRVPRVTLHAAVRLPLDRLLGATRPGESPDVSHRSPTAWWAERCRCGLRAGVPDAAPTFWGEWVITRWDSHPTGRLNPHEVPL